jgi:rSAM/selenodomain-associated transferase 2
MKLSIIIPTLNEADGIAETLSALTRQTRASVEIIVADGGSVDRTPALARPYADTIVTDSPGRAAQMNRGAAVAGGDVLLFLHADTRLPDHFVDAIEAGLAGGGHDWGYFDIELSGRQWIFRVIETLINVRTGLTAIASGDQALFMRRDCFVRLGGFPDIKLMEDIALSRRLKRLSRPARIRQRATTSSRRWQERGIARTIVTMWCLRLAYYCGADPDRLARHYR